MDEKNPLSSNLIKSHPAVLNRSGRPTNDNLIRFGPQPKSLVSQMLENIKKSGDSDISFSATNRSQKQIEVTSSFQIALDPDVDVANITNNIKDSKSSALDPDVDVANITNNIKDSKSKLYPCDFPNCKYVCKLSSNLVKHKRTHTSEKPYLCHLCSFRSNFINSLKVHQRTHTAERPYSCNYCSYRCNSSSNLKKHCKHRHSKNSIVLLKPEQKHIDSET